MKLDEQELKTLTELTETYAALCQVMGQLTFAKSQLSRETIEVERQYDELLDKEKAVAEQLSSKYGVGSIDLESGEFIASVN